MSVALFDLILGQQFLPFQLADLVFIGRDDTRVGRIQDALQQAPDLRFNLAEFPLKGFSGLVHLLKALVPGIGKHGLRNLKHAFRWR
ncbi:MAG: hypothetical protein AAGG57_12065 [Pseudomonadota bacterium]